MDDQAFDEFYAESFPRVTGQLYAMVGDRDEAQECVQEAFVRAWAHRGKLDRTDHPEAWVRATAYRLAVSRWRRAKLARRSADRAMTGALSTPGVSENHVALVTALKQLSATQRQALVLHHIADLPVCEVAREVGVPEGTIKARLSRGRTALATLLAEDNSGFQEGASHV